MLQALRAGVVPRAGLQHIAVGRAGEMRQMLADLDRVADGGSAFRLVVGEYGSGKTFFLSIVRLAAMEKKLVVMSADLAPERRLFAADGSARSLFGELARNMATRTKPDGEALKSVVERFAGDVRAEAQAAGKPASELLLSRLAPLREMTFGYDFAAVIQAYVEGHVSCCRFDGHRDKVFYGAGGYECNDASSAASSSSRR